MGPRLPCGSITWISGRFTIACVLSRPCNLPPAVGWPDMEPTRPPFAFKLLPSLTDVAFLMPIGFLFARMGGVHTLLSDCDTGWHIRTGEWIVSNHQVPAHDFFSFTKTGQPWYAWEWLSEVVLAWLNSHGGLATVVAAAILLISLTFTLLF